jgi:hypothetical protein
MCLWHNSPMRARAASFLKFPDHTQWQTTVGGIGQWQRPLPDNTQHSLETNIHAPGGIGTRNASTRAAADTLLERSAAGIGIDVNNTYSNLLAG